MVIKEITEVTLNEKDDAELISSYRANKEWTQTVYGPNPTFTHTDSYTAKSCVVNTDKRESVNSLIPTGKPVGLHDNPE